MYHFNKSKQGLMMWVLWIETHCLQVSTAITRSYDEKFRDIMVYSLLAKTELPNKEPEFNAISLKRQTSTSVPFKKN